MKCWISFILFLIAAWYNGFSQDNLISSYFPPSPTAAGLAVYGKTPMNTYTGTPSIEVPIYTVKEKSLEVPIVLSYFGKGYMPNVRTSWVGLNWNLGCGGTIVREIKDKPDEFTQLGYLKSDNNIDITQTAKDINDREDVDIELIAPYDLEPDIYYFNFGPFSGRFFMDEDLEFHSVPYNNFRIECNYEQYAIYEFIITTEDGTKYFFGKEEDDKTENTLPIEFTSIMEDPNHYGQLAVTWYLRKIEAQNGQDYIIFNYKHRDDDNKPRWDVNKNQSSIFTSVQWAVGEKKYDRAYASYSSVTSITSDMWITTEKRYLSSIETSDEIIFFNVSDAGYTLCKTPANYTGVNQNTQQLDEIVIQYKNTNQIFKKYAFTYGDDDTRPLRLDAVTEKDKYNNENTKYRFTYKNFNLIPSSSSNDKTTTEIDYWGFFNDRPGLLPSIDANNNIGNERDANPDVCDAGMLEYIYYPTGGYTKYSYEINKCQYRQYRTINMYNTYFELDPAIDEDYFIAGGVRIASVINSSGQTVSYQYEDGVLSDFPILYLNYTGSAVVTIGGTGGSMSVTVGGVPAECVTKSSSSIFPLNTLDGTHVGYGKVKEIYADGSYVINEYNSFMDIRDDIPDCFRFPQIGLWAPVSSRDMERGKVKKISYFDVNNNPVKIVENNYSTEQNDLAYRLEHCVFGINVYYPFPEFANVAAAVENYYIYPFNLKSTTTTTYNQPYDGNYMIQNETYDYNRYNQIKEVETYNSNGDKITNTNIYPMDYNLSIPYAQMTPEEFSMNYMIWENVIGAPVETYTSVNDKVIKGNLTTYGGELWIFDHSKYIYYPKKIYELQTNVPLGTGEYTASNASKGITINNYYQPKISFDDYDQRANLLQYHKENDMDVAIIWGYNQLKPIAEVTNCKLLTSTNLVTENTTNFSITSIDDCSIFPASISPIVITEKKSLKIDRTYQGSGKDNLEGVFLVINRNGDIFHSYAFYDLMPEDDGNPSYSSDIILPEGSYTFSININPTRENNCSTNFNFNVYASITVSSIVEHKKVAYTSFEEGFPPDWVKYAGTITDYTGTNTGTKCLEGGNIRSPLLSSGKYIVSFWAKGTPFYSGASVNITGGGSVNPDDNTGGRYELTATLSSDGYITINSSYISIDEIRIYPVGSQMTTYTYDPLNGVTSVTNEKNLSVYYEYDSFGRLNVIRDQDGNIVKKYDYNYAPSSNY